MRRIASLLLGSLLISAASVSPAAGRDKSPDAELARAIEGLVPGEPVQCIDTRRIRSSKIIRDTAIVYDAGNVVYVNHPRSGRESLDQWDVLVTRLHSSQLCDIDVVHLYDTSSRMQTGAVFLGDFVPYRKPRRAD